MKNSSDERGGASQHSTSDAVDFPVLIDDVKMLNEFNMTRCTVFTINAELADNDWVAQLRLRGIPFQLIGLTAVICRPEVDIPRFSDPTQIDSLFNRIEQSGELVVESGQLWIPNELFSSYASSSATQEGDHQELNRGEVWRATFGLIQRALKYQRELVNTAQFVGDCAALDDRGSAALTYSTVETEVFRNWSVGQIENARIHYQHQKEEPEFGVLQWRDAAGEVQDG